MSSHASFDHGNECTYFTMRACAASGDHRGEMCEERRCRRGWSHEGRVALRPSGRPVLFHGSGKDRAVDASYSFSFSSYYRHDILACLLIFMARLRTRSAVWQTVNRGRQVWDFPKTKKRRRKKKKKLEGGDVHWHCVRTRWRV